MARHKYTLTLVAYNQEPFIREAVHSALSQDCGLPMEIILSDDHSSDQTFEIMRDLVAGYQGPHQIRLNRNDANLGLVGNLNRVFDLASGDIIIYAAGDDISMPNRCKKLIDLFESTDALLAHSAVQAIDTEGNSIPHALDFNRGALTKTHEPRLVVTELFQYLGASGAFHTELLRKYGRFTDPMLYEDVVLGFRAALEGKVGFIKEKLVYFRVGSGISTRLFSGSVKAKYERKFMMRQASFTQYRKDALTYGLDSQDPVMITLDQALLKTKLNLAALRGDWSRFLTLAPKASRQALLAILRTLRIQGKSIIHSVSRHVS